MLSEDQERKLTPLEDFLQHHTEEGSSDSETAIDMHIFKVQVRWDPSKEQFLELVRPFMPNMKEDGSLPQEVGYIEMGKNMGHFSTALVAMAVGVHLGLWQLLTPKIMLGDELSEQDAERLFRMGLLTVAPLKDLTRGKLPH